MNIFKAPQFQRLRNQHHTCSVDRSINDLQILLTLDHFRINRDGMYLTQVFVIHLLTDNLNQILVSFKLDILGRSNFIHFVNDTLVMRSQYLCAIIPISLVAVVFLRVVRSCQDNTALASQMTDGKRHFRCRTHIFKQIYFNAVGRENVCRDFSKQAAVVTAVMTHNNRNIFLSGKTFVQIIGQTLCGCTYGIDIHAVGTYAHNTAQTTCSKFQILIECFYQFGLVRIFQHTFYFCLCFGIVCRSQPVHGFLGTLLDQFFISHIDSILKFNLFTQM